MDLRAGLNQHQTIVWIRTEPTFNAPADNFQQASESDMTMPRSPTGPQWLHHSPLRMSHDGPRNAERSYLTKTQEIIAVAI